MDTELHPFVLLLVGASVGVAPVHRLLVTVHAAMRGGRPKFPTSLSVSPLVHRSRRLRLPRLPTGWPPIRCQWIAVHPQPLVVRPAVPTTLVLLLAPLDQTPDSGHSHHDLVRITMSEPPLVVHVAPATAPNVTLAPIDRTLIHVTHHTVASDSPADLSDPTIKESK